MSSRPPSPGSIILGMAYVLAGNVFVCGFLAMFTGFAHEGVRTWAGWGMAAPGLVQLSFVLPLIALFAFLRRKHTIMGMVAMGVLVVLMNGVAFGLWSSGMVGGAEG